MRIAILGDIHSNLEALTAVVAAVRDEGVDAWVQVGDVVGYGPDPAACLDLVQQLGCVVCMGNHDAAVVDKLSTDYFNNYARAAIQWTRAQLRPQDVGWLENLPLIVMQHDYTVVHGSLCLPEQFGYVLTTVEAMESMRFQRTRLCFVGHSHVPAIYARAAAGSGDAGELHAIFTGPMELSTKECEQVLVNVGSVGQPRDEDPNAAYAIYDTQQQRVWIRRVPYDIATVQQKIRKAGLPPVLADRLSLGV